jgi:polysaccharide chain length determinant protein (PEP-CTERM system associated)
MRGGHDDHGLAAVAEVWSRRKGLVLAVFAMAAAASVSAALALPPIYRATATVIVEQPRTETGTGELESRLQLIGQEILSRSRLEGVIASFDLYPELRRRASMESVVARMRKDIRTESKLQPQPSGLGSTIALSIGFRARDPEQAARVANALAAFYLDEDRKLRERLATSAVEVLKAQLDEVKQSLDAQDAASPAHLAPQTDATMANLQRLQADLRTASDERMRAIDRRSDLARDADEAEAPPAIVRAGPGPVAQRLATKRNELADLRQRYSESYPDVIRLRGEVDALEREAAAEAAAAPLPPAAPAGGRAARLREALRDVDAEIADLRAEEARLRAEIADHIRRLEDAPRAAAGAAEAGRDQQTTRDLYDAIRKRYEQALLDARDPARPASSPFRILDPAVVPVDPAAPNRALLVLIALAGSLGLAAAAGYAAERLDTSLHGVDDLRAFTRVPVVASIPLIVTDGDRGARRRRSALMAASLAAGMGVMVHLAQGLARQGEAVVLLLARS